MAICIPAFSPDAVHGDGLVPGKDSSEASGGRTAGCCWQFVTYSATSGAEVRRITRLRLLANEAASVPTGDACA